MRFSLVKYVMFIAPLLFSEWLCAAELQLQPRIQVNAPHVNLSADVQAWLANNDEISVGVWGPSHPPLGEGMAYGQFQGIAADYLAMLEGSLQVKFRLHYYEDSSDALAALSQHEIQMVAMWNPARWPSKAAQATSPWLLDKSVLMMRESQDDAPASLDDLTLGVVPDDIGPAPIREEYPGSLLRYFPEFDQAMNAVAYGQINALWINRATADYLKRYQQISGLKSIPSSALPNLNLSFGIDRQLPELRAAIDSTLQQMPLASRMRIAIGWGLTREAVITRNPLGLNSKEEQWLHTFKQIPVIIDGRRPPISFVQNGVPAGFVVDMLDALTERYGLNFTLLLADEKTSVQSLQHDHPDALLANSWRLENITDDDITAASGSTLLTSPMVVIMQKSVTTPAEFSDLKGERLAINRDNPLIPWLTTWYPAIELTLTDDLYLALEQLKNKNVRGIIAPQFVARYLVESTDNKANHIAITVPSASPHLVMSASNSPSLPLDIVSKALTDLPPENVIELARPWHQHKSSVVPGLSDRNLLQSLVWAGVVVMITFISSIWIRRLRAALKKGQQSQEALSNQLNFTRVLIDNAPIALYARDREGHLLDYNQRWSETVDEDGEKLKGRAITDIESMQSDIKDQLAAQYKLAIKLGEPIQWSGPFLFNGQQHYLEGWTVPWRDNRGEVGGLIGGWLDITEKQALIIRLQQAHADLEQANTSKASFMQSMGHEVRTPLNAIIGLLEFELQSQQESAQTSENMPLIWESACNLLSLIGDVFDIFRADNLALRGTVRSVHLPQLIESTVALYRQQLEEKGMTLDIETALNTPRFDADSLLIIRIFSSLLRNAIKHSSGKAISVALYQGRQEGDDPRFPLVIEVANSGVIDEKILVNEMADTANGIWQETGISLSACQQMAIANGAELTIESDPEDGTTICLHFSAKPSAENTPVKQIIANRELKILIVDDYPPGRRALQQQLEVWGHHTEQANDGEQALRLWQKQSSTFDLMITDCTMPIIDGFSLTRMIREEEAQRELPALPIFGLTAMTGFETATRCLAAGMNECLVKPLSPVALQTVMQRYFPDLNSVKKNAPVSAQKNHALQLEIIELNKQDKEKLRQALSDSDVIACGHLAHRLRGAASLLQATDLYNACKDLELACETRATIDEIKNLAERVYLILDQVNIETLNAAE
ncbi:MULTISPECIES: transporter substrate-binding domain-containing protein [unclassified Enterobacter]|uniref:response regulator n=1 Tax=unclassified Enterobacter TaxID=2608935 RepID=UPI0015CEB9D4|nr:MULTISPECIES: transporter substrate-binding domain-containing protein [unclassified Enterobacter]MBB3306709.1 two-component system sensor histidine kinase EvgS [Enterobacter sp. Sphag1F]NYI15966.1 two-component system sensor histidine kinase EvgS [Enterobacter sp. Sphag71]